jgi:hypothetical protein
MSNVTTPATITEAQQQAADRILANLAADGRFAGKLWTAGSKCRIYVEEYGYIAIGQDGTSYPSLSRYVGNITRAAKL